MKCKDLRCFILTFCCLILYSCLYAQERDRPKDGEGIYSFLRRHKREAYYDEFIKLNKGKFGKNNSLLLHHAYIIPKEKTGISEAELPVEKETTTVPVPEIPVTATSDISKLSKGNEPLFGRELAQYDIVSSELKGATFYIVSGHGGPDPGAIGKMGSNVLHEDEYAYDIALRLSRNLMMQGAKVYIVIQDAIDGIRNDRILSISNRETCMGSPIPLKQFARLSQRCDKINVLEKKDKPAYSRAIFLHIDSRSIHKRIDVFFYHSRTQASKELAQTMRKTFADKYRKHQPTRGFTGTVEERGLYVLNQTVPVALFVELGNIQNSYDQQRFVLDDNRQALANWMCEGLTTDYKNHKK